MDDVYRGRLDALDQTWQVWAQLGDELTEEQWSSATRCPGWDVAALYAHHSVFPVIMDAPLPLPDEPVGAPVAAAEILRTFDAPDGVAHTIAEQIADQAVSDAARHTRKDLVDRFGVHGPRAVARLHQAEPSVVVPWPATSMVITLGEALRIVVLEATVHLLDVQRALDRAAHVPSAALQDTARLLAELSPAVEFIEAATGRSTHSPLPVLR
ncbi:MAG: maleylpyruvate isomerase N-terminal domain-containing protein [Pseudonocardiaceae bacterium]